MAQEIMGGQAVVDGVLMLRGEEYAVAVQGKKRIEILKGKVPLRNVWIARLPFIRGIVVLLTTLYIGVKSMGFSANTTSDDDEQLGTGAIAISALFSLLLALTLFKILPLFLANMIISHEHPAIFNIFDGVLRIAIFLAYLVIIGRSKEVKRMFAYHGAEHKVINAYEKTGKLSVAKSKDASRLHSRCSTSFVVLVLIIAIIVFSIVPLTLPFWSLLGVRLLLVAPIAGIAYEVIRITARHEKNRFFRVLLIPGFWVQKLTTKEPSEKQLRVAIAAAKSVLKTR